MNKTLNLCFVLALTVASASFAATITSVETARSHAATGSFGCTVTGATNATPIVVTCAAAHGLIDGDAIQITGVTTNTAANANGYAKRTGYSTTTFGLYSDANLATGVAGNGAYGAGGVVTMALPVSGMTGDWTLRFAFDSVTNAATVVYAVEESADGFVSDIRQIMVGSTVGSTGSAKGFATKTIRKYDMPGARFGTANVCVRLKIQAISAGTAVTNLWIEQ